MINLFLTKIPRQFNEKPKVILTIDTRTLDIDPLLIITHLKTLNASHMLTKNLKLKYLGEYVKKNKNLMILDIHTYTQHTHS